MKTIHSIASCVLCLTVITFAAGCDQTSTTVKGPGERAITLDEPGDVSLERGKTAEVKVQIERKDVTGPIKVSFSKLPAGVSVVDITKELVADEGTFVLTASDTADLVENHHAEVTVRGPEGLSATQTLTITIKEGSSDTSSNPKPLEPQPARGG